MPMVPTEAIRSGMRLMEDVVSYDGRILLKAGTILRDTYVKPLLEKGVPMVSVSEGWSPLPEGPKARPTDGLLTVSKPSSQTAEKTPKVNAALSISGAISQDIHQALSTEMGSAMSEVSAAFRNATQKGISRFTVGFDTERLKKSVDVVVEELLTHPDVVFNLQDIRISDEYTLNHSINVCVLSTLLGTVLGYDAFELKDLALGALLHDIGKTGTPLEILNKPDKLTEAEFAVMQQHTTVGWRILQDQRHVRPVTAIMALQHHERWTGGGYPNRLRTDHIYKFSRVCTVADCFDALTAERVYKKGMSPARALEIMMKDEWGMFQPGLVWSFSQCVAPFPVGSLVEITGGQQAVVLAVNRGKTFQPLLRVVLDVDGTLVANPFELDLSAEHHVRVIRLVRDEAGVFTHEDLIAVG